FYTSGTTVMELALPVSGQYLRSEGTTAAPVWGTPTGAGDMLMSIYDKDQNGSIDGNATENVMRSDQSDTSAGVVGAAGFAVGGDMINDFAGTGLSVENNILQATLGTGITDDEIESPIQAHNIGLTTVENYELDYLDGATDNIQTQINNKEAQDDDLTRLAAGTFTETIVGYLEDVGGTIYTTGGQDIAVTDGGTGRSSGGLYSIPWFDSGTSVSDIPIGQADYYLKVNGAGTGYTYDVPTGSGDMNESEYNTDDSGGVDVQAGGTNKTSYTKYAMIYA
ncbi:unnamed protein product, partial [marine sediment metagenome]